MGIGKGAKGPAQKNPYKSPSLLCRVTPEAPIGRNLASWGINATTASVKPPVVKGTPKAIVYHLTLGKVSSRMGTGWLLGIDSAIRIAPKHQFFAPHIKR